MFGGLDATCAPRADERHERRRLQAKLDAAPREPPLKRAQLEANFAHQHSRWRTAGDGDEAGGRVRQAVAPRPRVVTGVKQALLCFGDEEGGASR